MCVHSGRRRCLRTIGIQHRRDLLTGRRCIPSADRSTKRSKFNSSFGQISRSWNPSITKGRPFRSYSLILKFNSVDESFAEIRSACLKAGALDMRESMDQPLVEAAMRLGGKQGVEDDSAHKRLEFNFYICQSFDDSRAWQCKEICPARPACAARSVNVSPICTLLSSPSYNSNLSKVNYGQRLFCQLTCN